MGKAVRRHLRQFVHWHRQRDVRFRPYLWGLAVSLSVPSLLPSLAGTHNSSGFIFISHHVTSDIRSVQFSCSVMSSSLQPHGLQHVRPSCLSPPPRVYSNSCLLRWWCHPTISSSVVPFSSCLQSFPESGSFPMSQLFASGGQSIGVSAAASVVPVNIQDWSPLGWTGWISLQFKGLSRVFFNTAVQKASILQHSAFFMVQLSHPYMTAGKNIALTRWIFSWQSNVSAF